MTRRMILFIHGLGGNAVDTWREFPRLLKDDPEVAARYQLVESFGYATSKLGASRPLAEIASELGVFIDQKKGSGELDELVFITHSQGGLLARRYLCDLLYRRSVGTKQSPLFRLLTFATPHWGAYSKTVGDWLPGSRSQPKDLSFDSDAILSLNREWSHVDAEVRIGIRRVIAAEDAIVPMFSAMGANFEHDYRIVNGHGHIDIVKVGDTGHPSFALAKTFLLEEASHLPMLVNVDQTPPVLSTTGVQAKQVQGNNRFIYTTRFLPFVGREQEKNKLLDFLITPCDQNVAWMLIKGPGGVGKSRLALELALACQDDWHAGFLNRDASQPDWTRWQPYLPTLLILDYATNDIDKLGCLLRGLCNREMQNRLRKPVRIVLLDRDTQDDRLAEAIGHGRDEVGINLCRCPDLELGSVEEPWLIIESFLLQARVALPDRTKVLGQLRHIDKAGRPLFAMLLADALCHGTKLDNITNRSLLENVIKRDRAKYWVPAAKAQGVPLVKLENALAIATVVNGLSLSGQRTFEEGWDPDLAAPVFEVMSGYDAATDTVHALEPDLLGECFALDQFKHLNIQRVAAMLKWAWENRPAQTYGFFNRVVIDFPSDPLITSSAQLAGLRDESQLAWARWITNLVGLTAKDSPERSVSAFDTVKEVALANANQVDLQIEMLKAGYNLATLLRRDASLVAELLNKARALVPVASGRSDQVLVHSRILTFYIYQIHEDKPELAAECFSELQALCRLHAGDSEVQVSLAQANTIIGAANVTRDYRAALTKLEELRQLALDYPHPQIDLHLARMMGSIITVVRTHDLDKAAQLGVDLGELARRYPMNGELQEFYFATIAKLVRDLAPHNVRSASSLLSELPPLAGQHAGDDMMQAAYAEAINVCVAYLRTPDPDESLRWLERLRTLVEMHPHIIRLKSIYSLTIASMIPALATKDRARSRELLEEFRRHLLSYSPSESDRNALTLAMMRLVETMGRVPVEAERSFPSDLLTLFSFDFKEPKSRLKNANLIRVLILKCTGTDKTVFVDDAYAEALHHLLRTVSREYPHETELLHAYAQATAMRVGSLHHFNPELIDELRTLAEQHDKDYAVVRLLIHSLIRLSVEFKDGDAETVEYLQSQLAVAQERYSEASAKVWEEINSQGSSSSTRQ